MFKKIILSFTSLVIIGLVPFALSNHANISFINVDGTTPSGLSTQVVTIDLLSVGSPAVGSPTYRDTELKLDSTNDSRTFFYEASYERLFSGEDWLAIFSDGGVNTPFKTLHEKQFTDRTGETITETFALPGSDTNKFRLTGIEINLAKFYSGPLSTQIAIDLIKTSETLSGEPPAPTLTTFPIGNFISTTNTFSSAALNSNKAKISQEFSWNDNIKKFKITSSSIDIFIESMVLTYSIDYSDCPSGTL
jgi:hypothetical protein